MAFRFEKASCVVVGTFNIYILHPQWLVKHEIIKSGDVRIETNLTQAGFRLLSDGHPTWSIAPTRLAIETSDPRINCGDLVARVLKQLPETPVFAVGNNAYYKGDLSELEQLSPSIRDYPKIDPPNSNHSIAQRTFHVGIERLEHETVNLQISLKKDAIELLGNVNYDAGKQDAPNKTAMSAADRYFEDRSELKSLMCHFFGASITHDTTDN